MSHEIRTPMNAIIGFSELLEATVTNEKQKSQLKSILNSGKNLLLIINDILDLSKIEAGKLKLQISPVYLQNIIKDIETIFISKIKEKKVSFIIEKGDEVPPVLMLDEVRIRQILFNIIGNAVKFTHKGHIKLIINKNLSENKNKIGLILSVEDTGIGIPEDQFESIFEPFNQQIGQNTKKYGGTGLGLTITKRLVEMMNGKISVLSKPGNGSVFNILIPEIEIFDQEIFPVAESLQQNLDIIPQSKKLSPHEKEMLPELINKLLNELTPLYNEVIQEKMMDKTEDFGKMLLVLGQEFSNEIVSEYGNSIVTSADNFDIENLSRALDKFPTIIELIKSLLNQ